MNIRKLLAISEAPSESVSVKAWVRTRRDSKGFSFLALNDGSCLSNFQVVVDHSVCGENDLHRATTGASVVVVGKVVESLGKGQKWEMQAEQVEIVGSAPEDYPLQKKGHSPEFLRSIAHLRPRTNLFGAVFRLRSRLAFAVHRFFQDRDFVYVHTPVITASDCEGAGELFRVTTLSAEEMSKSPDGSADFFGKPTFLTVSGQLEAETFACALSNVYTFGPTFRAENSNTARHAAEFWMIEPEMAFCDLEGDMTVAEDLIQFLTATALDDCHDDLEFFQNFVDKDLLARLEVIRSKRFERVSYTDAVEILQKSGKKFDYKVDWGIALQTEHERFLAEEYFQQPVTVHDYPKAIKPFYMRVNEDDRTVRAMDLLVPGVGEIVGGSQREERLEVLQAQMAVHEINEIDYSWYVDLRRYGSVPHAGFGLGFERVLMLLSGVKNIRDVIPFPRVPGSAEF